jgi:multiple sugar transport system permease protein
MNITTLDQIKYLRKHFNKQSITSFLMTFTKKSVISIFRTVIIIGLSFVIIYPLIIKLSTSLKPIPELYDPTVFIIPKAPTLQNFKDMLSFLNYGKVLTNSVLLSALCGVLQTTSCTLVAYGIARFKFKGRGIIFIAALLTLVIPPQAILLPLYIQFQNFNIVGIFNFFTVSSGINLINTPTPFILMSLTAIGFKNGLYIYMLKQYFTNMPYLLEEAAYIDGCGPYKTFYKIMLPGAIPLMATIFLFTFVWQFTDSYYTTILTPNFDVLSVVCTQAGYMLASLKLENTNSLRIELYNNVMIFLVMFPLLILYLFTQKLFVQSIETSGIVG